MADVVAYLYFPERINAWEHPGTGEVIEGGRIVQFAYDDEADPAEDEQTIAEDAITAGVAIEVNELLSGLPVAAWSALTGRPAALYNLSNGALLARLTAGAGEPEEATAAQARTILNVEDGAAADQSDSEIETAYNNQVAAASQGEAEAGTETEIRRFSPLRVAQAVAALAPAGDMLIATYDPLGVAGDAFDMANMVEAGDAKVLTAAERAKLGYIAITQAVDLDALEAALLLDLADDLAAVFDPKDISLLFQDQAATPVTTDGDTVKLVTAPYGIGEDWPLDPDAVLDSLDPLWDENGLVELNGAGANRMWFNNDLSRLADTEGDQECTIIGVIDECTDARGIMFGADDSGIDVSLGYFWDGNSTASNSIERHPWLFLDGAPLAYGITRDQLHTALCDGNPHIFEARGVDLRASIIGGLVNLGNSGGGALGAAYVHTAKYGRFYILRGDAAKSDSARLRIIERLAAEYGISPSAVALGQAGFQVAVALLWFQSNTVGLSDDDTEVAHARLTQQFTQPAQGGAVIPATKPLKHPGLSNTNKMGPWAQFSANYIAANPTRRIMYLPAAWGGTGFADDRWNTGDDLYEAAVAQANAYFALNPDAIPLGIFGLGGQRDAALAASAGFEAALDATLAGFRSDITGFGSDTKIVMAEMPGDAVTAYGSEGAAIQAVLQDADNRFSDCAVAVTNDLATYDGAHYTDAAAVGDRIWTAYNSI